MHTVVTIKASIDTPYLHVVLCYNTSNFHFFTIIIYITVCALYGVTKGLVCTNLWSIIIDH